MAIFQFHTPTSHIRLSLDKRVSTCTEICVRCTLLPLNTSVCVGKVNRCFFFFFSSLRIIYTSGPQPSSRDTGTRDITRHSFTACGGHYQTERLDGFGLGFGITSALLYQTQSLDNKVKWDAFKPVWRLLFESPRVSVSSQGNQPIKMSVTADRDEDQNQILNIQLVLVLRAEITVTSGCRWFILGQCLSCITQHI